MTPAPDIDPFADLFGADAAPIDTFLNSLGLAALLDPLADQLVAFGF